MSEMTMAQDLIPDDPKPTRRRARWPVSTLIAGGIVALYLLVAAFGPLLLDYDPINTPLADRLKSPGSDLADGGTTLLGTDALGRDVFAQIVYGARTSIVIGVCVVAICVIVGVLIGSIAGYFRGWTDSVLARIIDVLQTFPGILLAIVIAGIFTRSILLVVVALAATAWISFARVTRGVVLSFRERYWVDAARLMSVAPLAILRRHILPFAIGPLVAMATLEFALVVLGEAGLSFLGIGLPADAVSWGQTIANGKEYLDTAWWISAFPGIALSVLVISVGLLGDQLTARYGRNKSR